LVFPGRPGGVKSRNGGFFGPGLFLPPHGFLGIVPPFFLYFLEFYGDGSRGFFGFGFKFGGNTVLL